nr:vegetative cell wall protein gp1-like [Macaca fascicularis]
MASVGPAPPKRTVAAAAAAARGPQPRPTSQPGSARRVLPTPPPRPCPSSPAHTPVPQAPPHPRARPAPHRPLAPQAPPRPWLIMTRPTPRSLKPRPAPWPVSPAYPPGRHASPRPPAPSSPALSSAPHVLRDWCGCLRALSVRRRRLLCKRRVTCDEKQQLSVKLLQTSACRFLCGHVCNSFGWIPRSMIAGSYSKSAEGRNWEHTARKWLFTS